MSDASIMYGFAAAFAGLSRVPQLGWSRYMYGATSIVLFLLALFHGGKTL